MKLLKIDKSTYRQRLKTIIIAFIAIFALLSVLLGSLFISWFGVPIDANQVGESAPSNFRFNLAGVIVALFICGAVLHRLREHELFNEVYYVWQVKQTQNLIYRKLAKVKQAAFDDNDPDALLILDYYYASLVQVYELDDNTLTMSTVNNEYQKVKDAIDNCNLSTNEEKVFEKQSLERY